MKKYTTVQEKLEYLFETKNPALKKECLEMDIALGTQGYPVTSHNGKNTTVRRLLAAAMVGCELEELPHNVAWRSKCHNRKCVNPLHGHVMGHNIHEAPEWFRMYVGKIWPGDEPQEKTIDFDKYQ